MFSLRSYQPTTTAATCNIDNKPWRKTLVSNQEEKGSNVVPGWTEVRKSGTSGDNPPETKEKPCVS